MGGGAHDVHDMTERWGPHGVVSHKQPRSVRGVRARMHRGGSDGAGTCGRCRARASGACARAVGDGRGYHCCDVHDKYLDKGRGDIYEVDSGRKEI